MSRTEETTPLLFGQHQKRAGACAKRAPGSIRVASPEFHLCGRIFSSHYLAESFGNCGLIIGVNAKKMRLADEFGWRRAEHFVYPRADVGKSPARVKDCNHVRETSDQMADEFLFLM